MNRQCRTVAQMLFRHLSSIPIETAINTSKYNSLSPFFVEKDQKDTQRSSRSPQNTTGIFRQSSGFTGFCYQRNFVGDGHNSVKNVRIAVLAAGFALFARRGRRLVTSEAVFWQVFDRKHVQLATSDLNEILVLC